MKLGYPCINRQIGCTPSSTFRLKNYSTERMIETISANLVCLQKTLEFNVANGLYFFRISSDTVPFASHVICEFNWSDYFKTELQAIGHYIKSHDIRISMHPDQFVIINALNDKIVTQSINELLYHCTLLNTMQLDKSAKIQIHVGGAYGDKDAAIKRFIERYHVLPASIKERLVVENDDKIFNLQDCLIIHQQTDIPIIFDNLHHECNNQGEDLVVAFELAEKTWQVSDGNMMVDYSSQAPDAITGKHTESINLEHFAQYLRATLEFDFDIMLEIKNKEKSALQALAILKQIRD
jgi:UV DNA damage endonuclease